MNEKISAAVYVCPMHSQVHEAGPGRCPNCGMSLVPADSRFKLLRHMLGTPQHLVVMVGVMAVLMAAAMMMMR